MSIQWTLVAGVMYFELAVTVILLLPFISPQRWNSIFKSSFLKSIGSMGNFYFKIFLGILVLLFVDAIRDMSKYNKELQGQQTADHGVHLDADLQAHMRLFRAQRNFYISGFSLVLWVVLQRITTLISRLAVTMAEKEAAIKQAESASKVASDLMKGGKKSKGGDDDDAATQRETNINNEMKEMREANKKMEAEYQAALKQAKSVSEEYDRLLKEHSELQDKVKELTAEDSSKKKD